MNHDAQSILTEADHAAAMAEVAVLWRAKSGSPESIRLDVLVTLIDAYEAQHFPMDLPDPIEALRFRMEQQGLIRLDSPGPAPDTPRP